MSTSPSKHRVPHFPPPISNANPNSASSPSSPQTNRLRRLQSAHALTSHSSVSNQPSLISQQRLQQHQLQQQQHHQRTFHVSPSKESLFSAEAPPVPRLTSHGRTRSNSDVSLTTSRSILSPTTKRTLAAKKASGPLLSRDSSLELLLTEGPDLGDVATSLRYMRYKILTDGVSSDSDGMSPLRIYIWLILLCAPPLPTSEYLDLIHRGASSAYAKIRNDTFRTLATDPLFRRRVSEASLIRLLNSIAWKLHDAKEAKTGVLRSPTFKTAATFDGNPELPPTASPSKASTTRHGTAKTATTDGSDAGAQEAGTYVQGMNVLAAPFLYAARSEAEAFVAFHCLLTRECPGYVRGAMDGVHRGLSLVDRVLEIVDPKLAAYLSSKSMHAELYAFPSVLTLCACTPPLPEVLHLWDFLFAYGIHLNLLCIVAQLVMMRDNILKSPSPTKILRSFPPLQAAKVKAVAISLIRKIPDAVYDEIVVHAK
ncbi:MAG: hypothetical protein M1825_001823 [Sarcosagium campestre]|nr:MAG: hypothetical protein M1825_001823 [Sarcosagium campestre]